ncbi:unnamed protein product, partial [Amoebophrya sp. A25]
LVAVPEATSRASIPPHHVTSRADCPPCRTSTTSAAGEDHPAGTTTVNAVINAEGGTVAADACVAEPPERPTET